MLWVLNPQPNPLSSKILLLILVMAGQLSALHLKQASLTRLPLNDVLFTEDVLLEVSARSRIDCSKKCVETEGCVMCTFLSSPQGPPGHCRLHSQLQTSNDAKKSSLGTKSYQRKFYCHEGYSLTCNRCLRGGMTKVNYTVARGLCYGDQAELATPQTAKELKCVDSFMNDKGLNNFTWVGADDLKEPGVYRWSDGTHFPDNSSLWEVGDPHKNSPGEYCVLILKAKLLDGFCSHPLFYLCQKVPRE